MTKATEQKKPRVRRATAGKLTDEFIRTAKPGVHRDGSLPGYVLRVGKWARTLELRLSLPEEMLAMPPHERPYPTTQPIEGWETAEQARAIAQKYYDRFRRGEPLNDKDPASVTYTEAMEFYIEHVNARNPGVKRNESSTRECMRRLSQKFMATTLRAATTDADLYKAEHLRMITANGPVAAERTRSVVNRIYRYVRKDRDTSLPPELPARRPPAPKQVDPNKKEEPALNLDEIPIWNAKRLALANEVKREFWLFSYLSGMRRGNLGGDWENQRPALRWEHWDHETNTLRMIQKGYKTIVIVLSKPMVECLERARAAGKMLFPTGAEEWVFPNGRPLDMSVEPWQRGGHMDGDEKDVRMLVKMVGTEKYVRTHLLRRTYTSHNGLLEENNDRLLGHTTRSSPVMRHYNIDAAKVEEYRALQEQSSKTLIGLLGPLGVTGKNKGKARGESSRARAA